MKKVLFVLLLLSPALILAQPKGKQSPDLKKLDTYLAKSLKDWDVPGMSVVIVKGNKVVFTGAYGVKNVETGEKVSPATIFPIASITKGFTAACMAMLVEEKKISWNDPVSKYLPWFELYDPYVTKALTIRDLLTHRSGLATFSGDLLWYGTRYNRVEVLQRAKYLKPAHGFRESFGYSNIMYIAATEVIAQVSGMSWEDFVKSRFLEPLGMKRTTLSITDMLDMSDVTAAHTRVDDKQAVIPFLKWDNMGGAGALNSSAEDMVRWMLLQLNKGTLDGKKYYSESSAREMWQMFTPLAVSKQSEDLYPSTHFRGYGMGWSLMDYHGRRVISHSGGYDGIISYCVLVPEENLGFVILTNTNSSLYHPVSYKILDVWLSNQDTDWSQLVLERIKKRDESEKEKRRKEESERVKTSQPSLPLAAYTGIYQCKMYGDATVFLENDILKVRLEPAPLFVGEMRHWLFNSFAIRMINFPSLPEGKVNFVIGVNGKVEEMRIDIPNPDFDFTELEFKKAGP